MTRRDALRRVGGTLLTLVGVSIVVFLVLRALPGDAITAKLGTESGALDEGQRQALERYYGLDKSLLTQYVTWLGAVVAGNLGVSVDSGQSVGAMLSETLPVTVELAVLACLIGAPAGILLGVVAASRPGALRDLGVQGVGLLGLAVPEFVLGSILVAGLASAFAYFPNAGAFVPLGESVSDNLSQMLYPAAALAVPLTAVVMRTTRSAYLEVAAADFVRTAHGKGLSATRVRIRHVLHNAGIPILTIVGLQFGYLLGGTVIVEQIFALPGVGRMLLNAILNRDYAVVQSTVLVIAVIFVAVNVLVDATYSVVDPRVRAS